METKKLKKILILVLTVTLSLLVLLLALSVYLDGRHVVLLLNGAPEMQVEAHTVFTDPGAWAVTDGAVYGQTSEKLEVTTEGSVDTSTLGEYRILYRARMLWMEAECERIVRVVDTTPPELTLRGEDALTIDWFDGFTEPGWEAKDACDGDLSEKVQVREEGDTLIYTVTDASGNTAEARRTLDRSSTEPVLTLLGSPTVMIEASMNYRDAGCIAVNAQGKDLSELLECSSEVISYQPGSYTVSYSIANSAGERVTAERTVTVVEKGIPAVVKPEGNVIYLTFDDGPGPYTSDLLDVLAQYNVKATFFVTNLYGYEDMIGRAYREGHSIAVHSRTHDYYTIYAGEEAYMDDFEAMEQIIYRQTGNYSSLFRFPGGSSNTVSRFNPGIMSRLSQNMQAMGYKYFDWNVDSDDAGSTRTTEGVYQNVTKGISGMSYAIVLQHDIKDYSVAAVERIILWGLENGYRFEALNLTSPDAHHGINN